MPIINKLIKGLLIILLSIVVSLISWYICTTSKIEYFWGGLPAGIISGVVFLVVNYYFSNLSLIKKIVLYLVILLIVSICVAKGGDWVFDIYGV